MGEGGGVGGEREMARDFTDFTENFAHYLKTEIV